MKNVIILLLVGCFGYLSAQEYCRGEQISIEHQMREFNVCYASEGYSSGDSWSLADYNGDLNGGNYYVLFIDMSATW
ncbi:MAG: hypothetical protein H8E85_03215 [Candidatus Marinimicrobia bacterium]|nr:hypothetical protein [Candidatus Neomarinimicrobiota bacterium]